MCFQAFMVALRVVEGNDFLALLFKLFGRLTDEEFDLLFAGAVIGLDLAIGLGMLGRGKDMAYAFDLQVLPQDLGDQGRASVREQFGHQVKGYPVYVGNLPGQLWKGRSKSEAGGG